MRQLLVQVPRGQGGRVLEVAARHEGRNLASVEAVGPEGALDLAFVHVSNARLEELARELGALPGLRLTLIPRGIMPLAAPSDEVPEHVREVEPRSPLEIFLAAVQSIGSWKGFLGYAAAAGITVWIGLFTDTTYLLIAAMLIAPFAGPAMNVAIGTALGERRLLVHGLARYAASLAVTIAVAALLSLLFGQQTATSQMVDRSQISAVAVLLPLVAGAAGALNLIQSERNSLVSGAAVGMLVAAALAPPAGLVGMAGAIGRWDMVVNGVFLLLLQLVGINLAGSAVFRAHGLSHQRVLYKRGEQKIFPLTLGATVLALAALLTWQFWSSPSLQRSSRAQLAGAR